MYSKFPFSLENIPRQQKFACFSLKFGCIVSGLISIIFSILVIAACGSMFMAFSAEEYKADNFRKEFIITVGVAVSYFIILFLSAIMLVGVVKEKPCLIKPWVIWVSVQVILMTLMFVGWTATNMINNDNKFFFLDFLVQFLILLTRFYMLMIVGSYYKQLVEEKGENERLVKLMNTENWYSA